MFMASSLKKVLILITILLTGPLLLVSEALAIDLEAGAEFSLKLFRNWIRDRENAFLTITALFIITATGEKVTTTRSRKKILIDALFISVIVYVSLLFI
jgi:hypothetical protein